MLYVWIKYWNQKNDAHDLTQYANNTIFVLPFSA